MSLWTTKSTHGIVVCSSSCRPESRSANTTPVIRHVEDGGAPRSVEERAAARPRHEHEGEERSDADDVRLDREEAEEVPLRVRPVSR